MSIFFFGILTHVDELNRIGTEHEKFGFEAETLRSINYEQIKKLLYGVAEKFGWDPIMDGDNILGLKKVINSRHKQKLIKRKAFFFFVLLKLEIS